MLKIHEFKAIFTLPGATLMIVVAIGEKKSLVYVFVTRCYKNNPQWQCAIVSARVE